MLIDSAAEIPSGACGLNRDSIGLGGLHLRLLSAPHKRHRRWTEIRRRSHGTVNSR